MKGFARLELQLAGAGNASRARSADLRDIIPGNDGFPRGSIQRATQTP